VHLNDLTSLRVLRLEAALRDANAKFDLPAQERVGDLSGRFPRALASA
jgi:hypothetical protein